jgi:hypothetical protein
MNNFHLNTKKAIEAIKLILSNTDGKSDLHKVFKILYFADMAHLAEYGRPIMGDKYIAMKNGPVPSLVYDYFKFLRNNFGFNSGFEGVFEVDKYDVSLIDKNLDLDIFSESEIEALQQSIDENKNFDFTYLTKKSHGYAYINADLNDSISFFEIAKEGGANDEMMKYINHQLEIESITSGAAW